MPDDFTFLDLCDDLRRDYPVVDVAHERFGHRGIAHRVAQRLSDERGNASVAIIGEYGSGKTTVRKLVTQRLEAQPEVRIIPISLWPYEGPDAAVQGILTALVEALASEVNVTALIGLPQRYREAIGGGGGLLDRFTNFLGLPRDPKWLLCQIDAMAGAIDCCFVVWIEDLERFAIDSAANPAGHEEQVAPVRALLHLVDESKNLSVILASTTAGLRFDVQKIARYVERIPAVKHQFARRYLRIFREGCVNGASFIDPAPSVSSTRLDFGERDDGVLRVLGGRRRERPQVEDAIVELVRTPRTLKQSLRRALETWNVFRGEIDLDHVIVMSVLREAEPDVFALIDEHIDELRGEASGHGFTGQSQRTKLFEPRLDELAKGERPWSIERVAAIEALIEFIFGPRNSRSGRSGQRPQGLGIASPTDYWQRYQTLALPEPGLGDQDILRMIKGRDIEALSRALEHSKKAEIAQHFCNHMQDPDDERVFEAAFRARIGESASSWPDNRFPPAVGTAYAILEQCALRKRCQPERIANWVLGLASEAVERNLTLVWWLREFFTDQHVSFRLLWDGKDVDLRPHVHRSINRLIVTAYAGRADELAAQLDSGPPRVLLPSLCQGFQPSETEAHAASRAADALEAARRLVEEQKANAQDDRAATEDVAALSAQLTTARAVADAAQAFEREVWRPFAELILETAQRRPDVVLPQLALLVTARAAKSRGDDEFTYEENADIRLFGAGNRARALFAGPERAELGNDPAYQAVRSAATSASAGPQAD